MRLYNEERVGYSPPRPNDGPFPVVEGLVGLSIHPTGHRVRECSPFVALRRSTGSSEDEAKTLKWSSSRPIKPRVNLSVARTSDTIMSTSASEIEGITDPAKTPPASTRPMLNNILYQNAADPGSSPGWPLVAEAAMSTTALGARPIDRAAESTAGNNIVARRLWGMTDSGQGRN